MALRVIAKHFGVRAWNRAFQHLAPSALYNPRRWGRKFWTILIEVKLGFDIAVPSCVPSKFSIDIVILYCSFSQLTTLWRLGAAELAIQTYINIYLFFLSLLHISAVFVFLTFKWNLLLRRQTAPHLSWTGVRRVEKSDQLDGAPPLNRSLGGIEEELAKREGSCLGGMYCN